MKYKISEMMKHLDEQYIDQLQEDEYPLDDLEVKRICHGVAKKYYKKSGSKLKRLKRILIVAVVAICSYTTLYALNQMNLFDFLFKENASNLAKSGKILGITDEHQNIKVTVKGVIGYEKTMSLIYEIEKTDGVVFGGNELIFYSYIEIEDQGRTVKYMINDNREIKSGRTPTKREYVATVSNYFDNIQYLMDDEGKVEEVKLGNVESFVGKKMKFIIEEVAERYDSEDEPDLDLVEYLKKQQDVESQPITKNNLHLICWDGKNKLEQIVRPTRMLEGKQLNLIPYNKFPKSTIDNIGFIDGKLHIRTQNMMGPGEQGYEPHVDSSIVTWDRGTLKDGRIRVRMVRRKNPGRYKSSTDERYMIEISNKNGEGIGLQYANYNVFDRGNTEKYEVYDIKDVEELSQYKITARIKFNEKITQDKWELPFEMDVEDGSKSISYEGKIANLETGESWSVDKINLANVYLSIQLKCQNSNSKDAPIPTPIKIIMKNQAEMTLVEPWDYHYDYTSNKKSNKELKDYYVYKSQVNSIVNIDGFFIKAIDISQVESIQIGDVKIPVN